MEEAVDVVSLLLPMAIPTGMEGCKIVMPFLEIIEK